MRRLLLALLMLAAGGSACRWALAGSALGPDEMRAILVLNLIRLAEWPGEEFGTPFRVCTLGDDSGRLAQALDGRPIRGGSVEVLATSPTRLAGCRIVYVLRDEQLADTLAHAPRGPALIIGESPAALAGGAAMRVTIHADHVDFDLNLKSLQQSGVILGSRLLRLAKNLR